MGVTARQRIVVAITCHHQVSAIAADALDLGGRCNGRHKNPRLVAKLMRRKGHGGPMIAAGGRRDAGFGHSPCHQVGKGPARFERPRVLHEFQLERYGLSGKAKITGRHGDHGCFPDMGLDDGVSGRNGLAGDCFGHGRDLRARLRRGKGPNVPIVTWVGRKMSSCPKAAIYACKRCNGIASHLHNFLPQGLTGKLTWIASAFAVATH